MSQGRTAPAQAAAAATAREPTTWQPAAGTAFNLPPHPSSFDAAGYASGGAAGFPAVPSTLTYPAMASLLEYAREREAALARERELALRLALLNRSVSRHHHHYQAPPHRDASASFDDPSILQMLLLSASLPQGQPANLHPTLGDMNAQQQAQLASRGYRTEAPPTAHPVALARHGAMMLPGTFDPREAAILYLQRQADLSFAQQREALLLTSAASLAGAAPACSAPWSLPLEAGRQPSWSPSGFAPFAAEGPKEGAGRVWPAAETSFRTTAESSRAPRQPPLLPLSLSSSEPGISPPAQAQAPPSDDSMSRTCQPPPHAVLISCRFNARAIPVSLPTDVRATSKFLTLLREQVLYVEAAALDVQSSTQGRNRPIKVGQVGILCRHCRNIPPRCRPRGAMYFPHKLLSIYQSAQNMANHHYGTEMGCPNAPDDINQALKQTRSDKSIVYGGGQQYWARAASESGVVEAPDDRGLEFVASIRTATATAATGEGAAASSNSPAPSPP